MTLKLTYRDIYDAMQPAAWLDSKEIFAAVGAGRIGAHHMIHARMVYMEYRGFVDRDPKATPAKWRRRENVFGGKIKRLSERKAP